MTSICLDGSPHQFHDIDFPILIHGKKNAGASYFSIELLISLFRAGKDIIILSGYSHARDAFLHETHAREHSVLIEDESSLSKAVHKRIIFLKKEKTLYLKALLEMPHMATRLLMVKNIELFSEATFRAVHTHKRIILSGDVDESPLKFKILQQHFNTKIYFSSLSVGGVILPPKPQFSGYMMGREKLGLVTIQKDTPQLF
jgi:hypothetical protein